MLHIKAQGHRSVSSEKGSIKVFTIHVHGGSCDLKCLNDFWSHSPMKALHLIW